MQKVAEFVCDPESGSSRSGPD